MKRFLQYVLTAAVTCLVASPVAFSADTNNSTTSTTPSVNVSPEERTKIESVVKSYLSQNPEVVIEAIQTFQRKQYEQAEKSVKETQQDAPKYAMSLFQQNSDPSIGNAKGTISVVEFFDYQCPHCVRMVPTIDAIVKANPNVRIIFKEWPIRGPLSEFAARAALAAAKQGKYYQLHKAMLETKKPLSEDTIMQMAKTAGLNVDKLKTDMNDSAITDQLQANTKLAQDLKLFGTPAFFVGQSDAKGGVNYMPGEVTQAQLQEVINKTK